MSKIVIKFSLHYIVRWKHLIEYITVVRQHQPKVVKANCTGYILIEKVMKCPDEPQWSGVQASNL